MYVISQIQLEPVFRARLSGEETVRASLDLGNSVHLLNLSKSGIRLPDNQFYSWEALEGILTNDTACFKLEDEQIWKVQLFSEHLNRLYTLMPTDGAPSR